MQDSERISLSAAQKLLFRALHANSVPKQVAESVAEALAAAEAEGQVGHGFSRLEDYVAQVRSGKIAADAQVVIRQVSKTGIHADAGHGFAYPALDAVITRGISVAKDFGTATMAVSRSHHCGALSFQTEKLARQGLLALMFANTPAAIAPWGGAERLYGTNPIAFSAPRKTGPPLVIDLSLSRVARGKVMNASKSGQPIPVGWALDTEGRPTKDPDAALAGSMAPIGGPKGTALALMVEIFAAVMTGAALSPEASSFFSADGSPPGVGQFLVAFRPPSDDQAFFDRLEVLLGMVVGMDGARLPGQRRIEALGRARDLGIDVPIRHLETARRLAGERL